MGDRENTKITQLIDALMTRVEAAADDEDWKESEGWVGKWVIVGNPNIEKVYVIKGRRFVETGPQPEYTGTVEMSEDTFLDIVAGSLQGRGEQVFVEKYRKAAIRYRGDQWIVDSERFKKVLSRVSVMPIRSGR
jgi:hypothetical protein